MKIIAIEGLDAIRALALETAQTWHPDYHMNKVQEMIFKKYHHIPCQNRNFFAFIVFTHIFYFQI